MNETDIFNATNCLNKQIAGLTNLLSIVHTENYSNIIKHLSKYLSPANSNRIFITGIGKNASIATKISETMASLGLPSFYLNTSHCPHGDTAFIREGDTVIHLSRSGSTEEMMTLINIIDNVFSDVVQIMVHCKTDKPRSKCDYELYCGPLEEGDVNGLAPTTSTTTILAIMDTIAVVLSGKLGFTRKDFYKFHPGGSLGIMLSSEQ